MNFPDFFYHTKYCDYSVEMRKFRKGKGQLSTLVIAMATITLVLANWQAK